MNVSVSSLLAPITKFLHKHHPVLFILLISILLGSAILFLTMIIQAPQTSDDVLSEQARISDSFDEATVKRIENLRDSADANQSVSFPSTRYNPFVE